METGSLIPYASVDMGGDQVNTRLPRPTKAIKISLGLSNRYWSYCVSISGHIIFISVLMIYEYIPSKGLYCSSIGIYNSMVWSAI